MIQLNLDDLVGDRERDKALRGLPRMPMAAAHPRLGAAGDIIEPSGSRRIVQPATCFGSPWSTPNLLSMRADIISTALSNPSSRLRPHNQKVALQHQNRTELNDFSSQDSLSLPLEIRHSDRNFYRFYKKIKRVTVSPSKAHSNGQ